MPTTPCLELENAHQRLGILPALGGCTAFWEAKRATHTHSILRPWDGRPSDPFTSAAFFMLPYCNRISGGGFWFRERFYPVGRNRPEGYPIHGNGWMQSWSVLEHSSLHARLETEVVASAEAPWHYRAWIWHALEDEVYTTGVRITHLGALPLPYGLGWHPYFLRGASPEDVQLEAPTHGYWKARADVLPTEHVDQVPLEWDFTALRPLGEGHIDHTFTGWSGGLRIVREDLGLSITLAVTQPKGLDRLHLYRPVGKDFFCVEPVTHVTNAVNREPLSGMHVLEPGETLALEVHLRLGGGSGQTLYVHSSSSMAQNSPNPSA